MPAVYTLIGAAVFVPLMWWVGSKLWRSSNRLYKIVGGSLRFFAILNAFGILLLVLGLAGIIR
jgi:hypothetical protein